jgi:hypothetical protein
MPYNDCFRGPPGNIIAVNVNTWFKEQIKDFCCIYNCKIFSLIFVSINKLF